MLQPMQGVRVLEVAQFTFVPAAGAILADWGAEVIKVEHAERGDGQRGLTTVLGVDAIMKGSSFSPMRGPSCGSTSRTSVRSTPTSSTCAVPASAPAARRRTRAATT